MTGMVKRSRVAARLAVALGVALGVYVAGAGQPVHAAGGGTFGKTTVGASAAIMPANQKQVSRYSLSTAGAVTKLSIYLEATGTSGQQVMKGIVYSDASGAPQALLGVSAQLTFTSTSSARWYDLAFSTPVKLAACWVSPHSSLSPARAPPGGMTWPSPRR